MSRKQLYKWIRAVVFVLAAAAISLFFRWVTIPNTYARIAIHSLKTSPDELFVGTSKGQCAIDPDVVDSVTGKTSANLCLGLEFPVDSGYLVKEAVRSCHPQRIIYELDPVYFVVKEYERMEDPFIANAMPASLVRLSYMIHKYLKDDFRVLMFPWLYHRNTVADLYSAVQSKCSDAYRNYDPDDVGDENYVMHGNGFLAYQRPAEVEQEYNPLEFDTADIYPDRVESLEKMMDYCRKHNIEFTAIVLPVPEESLRDRADDYRRADDYFANLCRSHGADYINFNYEDTGFDNSLDRYKDYEGHMWEDTARDFSQLLGTYL